MLAKTLTAVATIAAVVALGLGCFSLGMMAGHNTERDAAKQLALVVANYGTLHATRAQGDLNGDGTVNVLDLSQALSEMQ